MHCFQLPLLWRWFLTDPSAAEQYAKGQHGAVASEIARTLSSSRFQDVVEQARELDEQEWQLALGSRQKASIKLCSALWAKCSNLPCIAECWKDLMDRDGGAQE